LDAVPEKPKIPRWSLQAAWRALGPGLVTGAADDDPSGIATYSQAGAQFGFALTWTMLLTLPFMAAIQIISGCIGWQTRGGLARTIARHLPRPVLYGIVTLLVVANTINIAADLAAMGEALRLVIGGSPLAYALAFGLGCLIAEVLVPYHRYAGYLKLLTLVLLVYVVAAFSIDVPWGAVAVATFAPTISLDRDFLLTIVALFGTTISPYLFFWQASQEAEESRLSHRRQLKKKPGAHENFFARISIDTWIGMLFSNLIAFFIIVTAGATLHVHGITKVETAAQAAEALRPLAGELAFVLFAAGIIGTGLLAVPILAGSVAYAVAEVFRIRGSLEIPANRAIGFYAIVSAATLGGVALTATSIEPIAMLFWSAVINGVVALPIMAAIMLAISNPRRDKRSRLSQLPLWLKLLGWCASVMMALATGLLGWSYLSQSS
jgi:NRAMP (natural resistance-associated macrophage protein)-like metal ion transporter